MARKKTKQKQSVTSLHVLLDSLSFRGTIARTLLVALLLFFIFIVASVILGSSSVPSSDNSQTAGSLLAYFAGAGLVFLAFDGLYVWFHRIHAISPTFDRVVLFVIELSAIAIFLSLFLLITSLTVEGVRLWLPVALLGVLAVRYVIGALTSKA